MADVAVRLLGQPVSSTDDELRFGEHGSLRIGLRDGSWRSERDGGAGDTVDLVSRVKRCGRSDAVSWLRDQYGNAIDDLEPNGTAGNGPLDARTPVGFRTQPHNIDAEQALLGAILVNNEAYHRVADYLRPEHFYEPVHGRIFAAITRLIEFSRVADHVTLKVAFDQDESLRELDGAQYLARLARAAEAILNADDYGRLLFDLALRRGLIHVGEETVNKAFDPAAIETAQEQIATLARDLDRLNEEASVGQPQHFTYVPNDDLAAELPLRPFIIDRWIPEGCLASLYGSGGTGKSFLAMMMAMCVAAGRDWLGFPCQQASVLMILCEDDEDEIRRRRNKIARSMAISEQEIDGRLWLTSRFGLPNHMMEFPGGVATRTSLFDRTVAEAKRTVSRFVILDNAAQMFGGNENDRSQVTAFLNACAGIGMAVGGATLLLGHPPKMAGVEFSGSTAWDAVTRSRMLFKRIEADDENGLAGGPERYSLELVKSNYARRFGVSLEENGQGVVEYAGELTKQKKPKLTSGDRVFAVLRSLFETHHRAITQDEIVEECIRIGIYGEAEKWSSAWRDKTRKVRRFLSDRHEIDQRDGGSYALKP
jgi:hypothetical protein